MDAKTVRKFQEGLARFGEADLCFNLALALLKEQGLTTETFCLLPEWVQTVFLQRVVNLFQEAQTASAKLSPYKCRTCTLRFSTSDRRNGHETDHAPRPQP